jgi:O-acetyl-ADP-ribose deacetylase (regulator of RNase III)
MKYVKGNIFNSNAQTIVNTVNCVGVMGKGIALVFKLRYPKMFDLYKDHCKSKLISIGKLWLYKGEENAPWVLNFPTKFHWKYPSKIEYLEKGLQKFCTTYKDQAITSIAFPLLGTHNGGLDKQTVLNLMEGYLGQCDIDIEIYEYVPEAVDDLYEYFASNWLKLSFEEIKLKTGIRKDKIEKITEVVESGTIKSMMGLINEKGRGIKTMEKCFQFVMKNKSNQPSLFDLKSR